MVPNKSEASAKAGPGVLLGGEHLIPTLSGAERQQNTAPTLSEFQLQAGMIAARYGLSGGHAETILRHLRGLP